MAEEQNFLKPEQAEAINREGGNILVSASAGSGKTFVMIKRLIRLITEGKAKVDEILAATFTEAAAADMKEKLKRALTEEAAKGNKTVASELNKVATADICTLHAFCGRLIRTYFFAAGVAPDYKVADEAQADVLKNESMDETFRALYKAKDEKFLKFVDRYRARRKDDALKAVIRGIYDYCISETDPERLLNAYKFNYTEEGATRFEKSFGLRLKNAAASIGAELNKLKSECEKAGFNAGANNCDAFIEIISAVEEGGQPRAKSYSEAKDFPQITRSCPAEGKVFLKDRLKNLKARIKSLCEFAAAAEIDRESLKDLNESGETLSRLVLSFKENYDKTKRENNVLDFADLERLALTALKDENVRLSVRKKYKYVFVDEYQDVNGVQEEIISAITDGNLFMVGDVKQSIYGFRGCRAEIFEGKQKTVEEKGGAAISLNCNFRSADNVIDFINRTFDFCYVPEYTGLDYRATARLKSGGIYPAEYKGRAALHHLVKVGGKKTERPAPHVYDILGEAFKEEEKEAASVSNLLAEIIDGELRKKYYDIKTKTVQPVHMRDIAILTRAGDTAYVKGIVEGLNGHGIRVVSGVSQNVRDFPEIKTLINALKLIDCFYQDAPLVGTLLSVIGGFTEEDLTEVALYYSEHGLYGGFSAAFTYYAENADTPLKTRFKAFKDYFDNLRYLADFKGAKGILDKIISDSGYENYILAENDGDEKIRRLYRFLAETQSGDRLRTVSEFLLRVETSPKAFEFSGGGEENAVKVMTVHSSKGLEYPVVIVCGLEKPFSRKDESKPVLCDRDEGFFALAFDDKTRVVSSTGYREMLKAKMRETQIKEEMRLFYVALTRAAYSLHLVFEKTGDDRSGEFSVPFTETACFLDFVPKSIPAAVHLPTEFGLTGLTRRGRQVLVAKPDEEKAEQMKKDFGFIYPFLSSTVLPLKNSVTAAAKGLKEEAYPVYSVFKEDGATDPERGTIAHKILELYDFGGEFYGQIKSMQEKGYLSAEQIAKVDVERLRKVIESDALKDLKGKTLFREQDFIVNIAAKKVFDTDSDEEVLLQGIIDLLVVSENGAEIIDYKYSTLGAESLRQKYSAQLNLYAYAVERSLKLKVVRKTLVNIFTGETAEIK